MSELHILLVDDHPIIRHGLRALLEAQPGWKICSEAATGQAALRKVKRLKPNIVLLDLGLPDLHGHDVIPRIIELHPQTGILVLSEHESREIVSQALALGARGLVLKSDALRDVIHGVRAVARGKPFHSRRAGALLAVDSPGGAALNLRATLTSRAANPGAAGGRQVQQAGCRGSRGQRSDGGSSSSQPNEKAGSPLSERPDLLCHSSPDCGL